MNTNRRNFFKKAAVTAPGITLVGAIQKMPGKGKLTEPEVVISDHSHEDGWLNARECGVSGSTFQTTAASTSGSRQITVADVGDFKAGQGIMVSKCNIRYERTQMWSFGIPYVTHGREVGNSFEIRGYDGSAGSWVVYVLDIAPSSKPAFRWTEDLGHTWQAEVPITHDWQPLSGGVEVKFNQRDWEVGYVIAFGARDQLITRIEKIEGNVLTLKDEANRSVDNAIVRHNDTVALQEAVDRGVREKLNIFVPVGHYMLAQSIKVRNANAIRIEGGSSVDTVLDISEGEGACFTLSEGTEVTVRNFNMIGFMGFDEADKGGSLSTKGSTHIWGFWLKYCKAIDIRNTERVLIENCHASKMSGEAFESQGRSRGTAKPGEPYTQWITYNRCSVVNSARNAFNDVMSSIENTSILNCRIIDCGGNAWEGASRFVKFTGNYVRNSGPVGIGNLGPANREAGQLTPENRHLMYPDVGAGQHIVADNVFEGAVAYGGRIGGFAVRSSRGSTQVIVRNNLFINFNSSGVDVSGTSSVNEYPSANTIITGNIFDMTCVGNKPVNRTAINVGVNDTIISDNQIYVRGKADPLVTGIMIREPALNMIAHDNLIRNCGKGIVSERGMAEIGEVVDDRTFLRSSTLAGLPLERIQPDNCKGWTLVWRTDFKNQQYTGMSVIESFDPEKLVFRLREPYNMKKGDRFEIIVPYLNWTFHDNTVTDCIRPVVLNSYGSRTSIFRDNLVTRGKTSDVPVAVEVHGCFQLINNRFLDFDEDKAIVLSLNPDAIDRSCNCQYIGNIFENCFGIIKESQPDLWKNSLAKDNLTMGCIQKIPKK
jgi:hypothetical protein